MEDHGKDATPPSPPATPEPGTAPEQPPQPTPDAPPGQAATPPAQEKAEDVYDRAFAQFLGPDAGSPEGEPAGGQGRGEAGQAPNDGASSDTPETPALSDDQVQLLKRNHLSPEMLAGWSDTQREAFLSNAAKREADQQSEFNRLREAAKAQPAARRAGGEGDPETGEGEGQPPDPDTPETSGGLAGRVQKVVGELEETFGPEIKPLGDLMGQVNEQLQAAEQSAAHVPVIQQMLAEMAIDSSIRDLAGDYPSLNKAEARQKVIERFHQDWQQSPHRTSEGRMLDRVRSAISDATRAEFGNQTESAAQVALANQTKQRLRSQPPDGGEKHRPRPRTQDDLYDQAFDEFLKPELS